MRHCANVKSADEARHSAARHTAPAIHFIDMNDESEILYNDTCPICSREVAAYGRLARRTNAPLRFVPLSQADPGDWGLSEDGARRRLHLRRGGKVVAGAEAFRLLWAELPGWRWLGWLFGLPLVRPLTDFVYERVLAPMLFALDRRRRRRAQAIHRRPDLP